MRTYRAVLADVSPEAIIETAQRFVRGHVRDQSKTFAPSVAEFVQEAIRVDEIIDIKSRISFPDPNRPKPISPRYEPINGDYKTANTRMRLKMPMYQYAYAHGKMNELAKANVSGMDAMILLATSWGIPIPDALADQTNDDWQRARNRALADIERNPPPYLREGRKRQQTFKQAAE